MLGEEGKVAKSNNSCSNLGEAVARGSCILGEAEWVFGELRSMSTVFGDAAT